MTTRPRRTKSPSAARCQDRWGDSHATLSRKCSPARSVKDDAPTAEVSLVRCFAPSGPAGVTIVILMRSIGGPRRLGGYFLSKMHRQSGVFGATTGVGTDGGRPPKPGPPHQPRDDGIHREILLRDRAGRPPGRR